MSIETFDTYAAYDAAVLSVIQRAQREIQIFEIDLKQSVLPSARAVSALQDFLNTGANHTVTLLLHDTGHLARDCARLLDLYRKRHHQFAVHVIADEHRAQLQPFVAADGKHVATRFHADHPRGKMSLDDEAESVWFTAQFETLFEASSPASNLAILGI